MIIDDFLEHLRKNGIDYADPSQFRLTDKWRRFDVAYKRRGNQIGSYKLVNDDGGSFGIAKDHCADIKVVWTHYDKSEMSEQERREFAQKRTAKIKQAEIDLRKKREAAAKEAFELYESASTGAHPYIERKKIDAGPSRVYKGDLIIPLRGEDGKVCNLQRISEKGEKKFLPDGEVSEKFCQIGLVDDPKGTAVIVEGFATGVSVFAGSQKPTRCAMNAGNLGKVAKLTKKQYPACTIIVAGDSDQWTFKSPRADEVRDINRDDVPGDDPRWKDWRTKGYLYNPGIEKARQAAQDVGGYYTVPPFPEDDREKRTDWNDWAVSYGTENMIKELRSALVRIPQGGEAVAPCVAHSEDPSPPPPEYDDGYYQSLEAGATEKDWRTALSVDEDGKLKPGSLNNCILFLCNLPEYEGIFRLNDFHKEVFICRRPDWQSEKDFKVHKLDDNDITLTTASLERFGQTADTNKTHKAILIAAERDKFNPAREYFESLVWDGKPRLDTWLIDYMGAAGDRPVYLSFIGKKWLTAAVKRVFEPGCKFDHVLVMEGMQGRGKSTAFELMATFGDHQTEAYFKDNIKLADIQNKDTIMMLQGTIIAELAELAGFSKKDDEEIKGWITMKTDRCRLPYARTITEFPRQFVLCGTTNNYEYLKDPTGNRRYWPFESRGMDLKGIERDRKQIWAEAYSLYRGGLYIGPTDDEMVLACEAQSKRLVTDPWEQDVLSAIKDLHTGSREAFKTEDVMRAMGMDMKMRDHKAKSRVVFVLRKSGYENVPVRNGGVVSRCWTKREISEPQPAEEEIAW